MDNERNEQSLDLKERLRGVILGTAVGDSVGLPFEGVSRTRVRRFIHGRLRHRLFFGKGMLSDDTEHTFFVGQALLAQPNDPQAYIKKLSQSLRWWLLGLPAGVGFATLRSIGKLWLGVGHEKSGVYSAGNGPAMRAALLGVFFYDHDELLEEYLKLTTTVTHTDPKALTSARAVAHVARWITKEGFHERPPLDEYIRQIRLSGQNDSEWESLVNQLEAALKNNSTVEEFADSLGLEKGVSGYSYHTVPVALYAWYRHFGDYEATLTSLVKLGGDTDTVGAIAGALTGVQVGAQGIPDDWLNGIVDWPRGKALLEELAVRLAGCKTNMKACTPVGYFRPGVLVRNVVFLVVVLMHGFRRLLPPY